ncbi:MAG: hypothetical protein IT352_15570 [Gemmatimonadales bacterium]|nr:hypothetical protein [Gemmatimonadales bacterium]
MRRTRAAMVNASLRFATALLLAAAPAEAQPPRPAGAGWLPPKVIWLGRPTPSERATMLEVLHRLEVLLRAVPELATPTGFEIRPVFSGGHVPEGPDGLPLRHAVFRYHLGLEFYAPSQRVAGEGCTCISIVVNDDAPPSRHRGEGGLPIYLQTELSNTPISGATEVWGGLLDDPRERSFLDAVFVTAGDLPWRPVTREQFIRALLLEYEGAVRANAADVEAGTFKTPYQEWLEGAAERRRAREQTLREMATLKSAAEVARLRASLEASEQDVTQRLQATDAADRESLSQGRARAAKPAAEARATLAAMSAAERQRPALIDNALDDVPDVLGYRLSDNPGPPAWHVRTPNYDFWRVRRSPVEVRSIRVHIGISGTGLHPRVQPALLQTARALDWASVGQMLERPRP